MCGMGGGEIFDKVSNTAFSRAVGNQTYRNNNVFLVKALFTYHGTNDAVPVITEKLQPQQEVSVQSNYTLVAVMKIE